MQSIQLLAGSALRYATLLCAALPVHMIRKPFLFWKALAQEPCRIHSAIRDPHTGLCITSCAVKEHSDFPIKVQTR